MKTVLVVFLLAFSRLASYGRKPELPADGVFPFIVHFESRSRGLCVGSLVSRVVVLTAAVCVAGPNAPSLLSVANLSIYFHCGAGELYDTRPIHVVTGTGYRHPSRGIRVPVISVLMPKLPEDTDARMYMLQKSVALLLLQKRVPDIMAEQPLRAIELDYMGEGQLAPQAECIMIGWHFFYAEDKIRPEEWWRLHRRLRYQVLQLVDKEAVCGQLVRAYESYATLSHVQDIGDDVMCFTDPNRTAQPCHGMYGAPLVCAEGRVAGLLAAPALQWRDCNRQSILVHKLSSPRNRDFLECADTLLRPEYLVKWEQIRNKTK